MKHIWKILFLVAIIAIFQSTYSKDIGVSKIDVLDKNTIKVQLSENPNLKVGENEADITILNDIKTKMSVAKEGSLNEVEILLEKPLLPNTKYSLLTVAGAEGSIDFTTPAAIEGYTQANLASTAAQDIAYIEMIDTTTILVRYVQNISGTSYEYKLLAESKVLKIEKPSYENPEIIISVEPPLESEQNYIMMVVDMKDVDGKQIEFDTGIYDFTTPVFQEVVVQETTPTAEENLDLKAAPEQVSLVKEAVELTVGDQNTMQNVEQIAANVQETPETGATTWVLICITLIINTFLFFTRRKKV